MLIKNHKSVLFLWQSVFLFLLLSFSSRKLHKNYQIMSDKTNSHICLMLCVYKSFHQSNMAGKETIIRNCRTDTAPQYLKAYCIPVSSIPSRSTLRSLAQGHLFFPSLDVLLLWAHWTGTSYLSPLEIFCNIIWSVSQTPENLPICQWRHWHGSGAPLI